MAPVLSINLVLMIVSCSLFTSGDAAYKVVCYFTNWAIYRPSDGSFSPEQINPDLCTHFIYAFAILNNNTIVSNDPYTDYSSRLYERVTALQRKGKKVLISVGGHIDSAGDKYSKLARRPDFRAQFAKQVTNFILQNNFNGLDIDWEFPVCWNSNCRKGPYFDRENFVNLLKTVRAEFNSRPGGNKLLLSIAVAADREVIDIAYDVPRLSEICDWMSIMGYEYHGNWETYTGLVAPFTAQPGDIDQYINVRAIINYYIQKGVSRSKLLLGIPTFGTSVTLISRNRHNIYDAVQGSGVQGPYTREDGKLAFFEIVKNIRNSRAPNKWKVVHLQNIGTYAYEGKQWVGYDDVEDVAVKSRYIVQQQLGGAMIWTIDMDHFMDTTCKQKFPITSTISSILKGVPVYISNCT